LRALKTLSLVETGSAVPFRDYRSLCGLLEHIRFAVHQRRVRMYGLYSPFRALRRGASAPDPEQPVRITAEMTTRAAEWSKELVLRPGAWCSGILRQRFEASPSSPEDLGRCLFGYSDAALEGAATPCFGGWFHGSFFSVPIPVAFLVFAIPILEFLAAICAALAFRPLIGGARAVLVTDPETCSKAIRNDGAHTANMQFLHGEFDAAQGADSTFSSVAHGYGEVNPFADLASRGRLQELHELCAQHGIRASRLPAPPEFLAVLDRFERFALSAAGGSRSPPQPPVPAAEPPSNTPVPAPSPSTGPYKRTTRRTCQVFFKSPDGATLALDVCLSETLASVRPRIAAALALSPE